MPELRKDPIIDRWVIIASERGRRPTDFTPEPEPPSGAFCPFCPGNESKTPPEIAQWGRSPDAALNTQGWDVRVVANKFPALSVEGEVSPQGLGMFDMMNGVGAHEVIIEHPRHDWDICDASSEEINRIIAAYTARMKVLGQDKRFHYILVFRNSGTAAGASLSHPHSQIIALPVTPKQVKEELNTAREHYRRKERCIYCDLLNQELSLKERIVEANDDFIVLSPFAARFPFELQIYPRHHSHDFTAMTPQQSEALGQILTRTLRRINLSLNNPAYNLMVHTAPVLHPKPGHPEYWGTIAHDSHWYIDIYPRLTKIAGFEWGTGCYINPVAPERATEFLKEIQL